MAEETLLSSILRSPHGGIQSFLEGVFNPRVQYDEITNGILGQLSNDDTNAMRRINPTMNNHLTALKPEGTLRHSLRDKCDAIGLNRPNLGQVYYSGEILCPCPNRMDSSAHLIRCTERELDYSWRLAYSHRGIENFLVCTTCNRNIINHPRIREYEESAMRLTRWYVCAVCTEAQEHQYPNGALFCTCFNKCRVLCFACLSARYENLICEGHRLFDKRKSVWRDDDGRIRFHPRPYRELSTCLGCGIRPCTFRWFDERIDITKICVICRNYSIVALSQQPSATPSAWFPPATRRSARLHPIEKRAATLVRLSYHKTAQRPKTESQGPNGFPIPSSRRR